MNSSRWVTHMLRTLLFFLTFVFLVLFVRWGWFFQDMDISLRSVHERRLQGVPVYLASYADGDAIFMKNQNTLALSAINRGIDHIFLYRRMHLAPEFVKKNKKILEEKRGAGLWLWKPYIILKTLEIMPPNALLLYLDSGYVVSASVDEFISLLGEKDILLVTDDLEKNSPSPILKQRATLYSMQKMGCMDQGCRQAPAIMAASLLLKNTPFTRAFVAQWLAACQDEALLRGYAPIPNDPDFLGSQEDQSLLGILAAKYKDHITFVSFHDPIKEKTLSWYHRRQGATDVKQSIIHQTRLAPLGKLDRLIYRGLLGIHKIFESS